MEFYSTDKRSKFQESDTFMSTGWIYDVARRKWYEQVTTGDVLSALIQGCFVLALA
jgi:hypothetical protein